MADTLKTTSIFRGDGTSQLVDLSARIESAAARLSELHHIKRKVGIVRMWPDQAVAEHENIERFRTAFRLLGVEIVEVDRYGIIIKSPNQQVTSDDVDFVIHLHFETSKTYNVTSVAAMWNPTAFYYEWGFERFWSNQMTHDVFAITGSEEIVSMLRATRGLVELTQLPVLNHSLAEPIFAPAPKAKYRVFYCGINWEVISGKKGRHDAVLKSLDAMGLVDIYGPRSLQGKPVWGGFKGYRQPLPFDGKTIIEKIAEAGTCLVFSSEAHIQSDIMSNRLFEALAAGAVIFGDEHPFIRKAIGENYIEVNSDLPANERAHIIANALDDFAAHPDKAVAMATAAQNEFISRFFFCDQLVALYEAAQRHKVLTEVKLQQITAPIIDFVIQPIVDDAKAISDFVRSLHTSLAGKGRIVLVVPKVRQDWFHSHFGEIATIIPHHSPNTILNPFECVTLAGASLTSPKVSFLLGIEEIFSEAVLTACLDLTSRPVGRMSHILKHYDTAGSLHYDGRSGGTLLDDMHDAAIGSVIFDTAWLKNKVPLSGLQWKDICRMAEIEEQGVVVFLGTGMTLSLRDYEHVHAKGMRWSKTQLDAYELIKMSTQVKNHIAGSVIKKRLDVKGTQAEFRNLNGRAVVSEIKALPIDEKWSLTLDLYKSTPLPGWVKRFITFTRKIIGIR